MRASGGCHLDVALGTAAELALLRAGECESQHSAIMLTRGGNYLLGSRSRLESTFHQMYLMKPAAVTAMVQLEEWLTVEAGTQLVPNISLKTLDPSIGM